MTVMVSVSGSGYGPVRRMASRLRGALPVGRGLSDEVWERRHRGIVVLLAAHVPALVVFGVLSHHSFAASVVEVLPIALCSVVAARAGSHSRGFRAGVATLGLVTCSGVLVHFSRGVIEMHFHFFFVVGVVTLYQDWIPFGLALLFVVVHHGVVGVLDPSAVYDHGSAQRNPWLWAMIHAAFVLATCVAHLLSWRLNEDQALRDPLTRLPNRALFADRLRLALARRARFGTHVAVLFIDLDGFKGVNDTLGHHGGDALLVEVGRRMSATVRLIDTAARFGGDEFAVLLDNASEADALLAAERLLEEIAQPIRIEGREVVVSGSVGLMVVDHEVTVDDVMRNADLAMYMAKAAGRGRIEVFDDSMSGPTVSRAELENDLRDAIDNQCIEVYYQPSVELDSGAITGLEALARWNHAERGPIPPAVFIPIAEASGLIAPLGRHVLAIACADAARWRLDQPGLTVAVNISVIQLTSNTLVDDVAAALRDSGLDASALVLEMTESVLAQDIEVTARRLHELKALGVRIAIDDFGTGYSALSYLRHFPIDILKIDRAFVDQLPGDGAALARSIVRLGHSLNLDVIAEGVEDDAQRDELTRLGCHRGQGFLFAQPTPAPTIGPILDAARSRSRWWSPDPNAVIPAPRAQSEPSTDGHIPADRHS